MNKELKLVILRGLPACGKSFWADEYITEHPNFVKIEKDQIRKDGSLFKGGEYNHQRGDESIVLKERDRLIRKALSDGKSVISSDTNLVQKHITQLSNIAKQYRATVEIKSFLDVPIAELIERDKNREDSVGEQVIRRMFHTQVGKMPTFLKYDPNLPTVVVTDLDGTLTKGPKDRSPYEWHKVGQDEINLGISHMLDGVAVIGQYPVWVFSGRDGICRPETEEWLDRNDVEYEKLVMREIDDNRSDAIVKSEFIEEHVRGKVNILIWFDDRPRVANMLRDVYGINVFQGGDPNYEF